MSSDFYWHSFSDLLHMLKCLFLMRVQVPGRTCHVIGGAQCKMKMQGPLFKNCAEFQGSHGRALKQEQATSG